MKVAHWIGRATLCRISLDRGEGVCVACSSRRASPHTLVPRRDARPLTTPPRRPSYSSVLLAVWSRTRGGAATSPWFLYPPLSSHREEGSSIETILSLLAVLIFLLPVAEVQAHGDGLNARGPRHRKCAGTQCHRVSWRVGLFLRMMRCLDSLRSRRLCAPD